MARCNGISYTFYDVEDGYKPVLVDAKHKDVCTFLGVKSFSYNSHCKDGRLCYGKYKVVRKVDGKEKERDIFV